MLSSDHPSGPRLPGQRGSFFDRELVTDRWVKDGVEVVQHFWRRPLSHTVDAFADAGFVVDRIAEPQPSADSLARFPGELAAVVGTPVVRGLPPAPPLIRPLPPGRAVPHTGRIRGRPGRLDSTAPVPGG